MQALLSERGGENMKTSTEENEIYGLISAQLDMLEGKAPLASDQLEVMHNRAERIRMLCKAIGADERDGSSETQLRDRSIIRKRVRAQSLAA
jgi:hypothetical protein